MKSDDDQWLLEAATELNAEEIKQLAAWLRARADALEAIISPPSSSCPFSPPKCRSSTRSRWN